MPLRESDVFRSEIITAPELLSDGYGPNSIYLTAVINTTAVTQTIVVFLPSDDTSLVWSQDYQVDPGDSVALYNTQPGGIADGTYTIDHVIDDTSFMVVEPLPNSTDGYVQFKYPAGARLVGYDDRNADTITSNNVQDALQELDFGKISPSEHETLRQLIHFIDEGPADGFVSGAYKVITPSPSVFPTSVIWYVSNTMTQKIVEEIIVWSGVVPTTITWKVYKSDGVTVAHTVSDNITYTNNIFESTRTRTIS